MKIKLLILALCLFAGNAFGQKTYQNNWESQKKTLRFHRHDKAVVLAES